MKICKDCCRCGETGMSKECAFTMTGVFDVCNYKCPIMRALRYMPGHTITSQDEVIHIIPTSGVYDFVIVTWYKERGCTEGFYVSHDGVILNGSLLDAMEVLDPDYLADFMKI